MLAGDLPIPQVSKRRSSKTILRAPRSGRRGTRNHDYDVRPVEEISEILRKAGVTSSPARPSSTWAWLVGGRGSPAARRAGCSARSASRDQEFGRSRCGIEAAGERDRRVRPPLDGRSCNMRHSRDVEGSRRDLPVLGSSRLAETIDRSR